MDVRDADESSGKHSDKHRCANKINLPRITLELRKHYSSILESYEQVLIPDGSGAQRELDRRDES